MKKLLLATLLVISMVIFVACEPGYIRSEFNITNASGAGTKSISVEILKDGAVDYDDKVVENQALHFPNGTEAIKDKLLEISPLDDLEVTYVAGDESDIITMTYSFDSIEDYNNKTRIMAQEAGLDIFDAALTEENGMYTFVEDSTNFRNSIEWALEAVYNDPEVYDNTVNSTNYDDWVEWFDITINLGDASKVFDLGKWGDLPDTFTLTGKIEAEPTPEPTPEPTVQPTVEPTAEPTAEPTVQPTVEPTAEPTAEPTTEPTDEPTVEPTDEPTVEPTDQPTVDPTEEPADTPKTGDNGIMLFAVAILLSSAVLYGFRKRIFN